jgi:tRNA G18 (ribose-2'-O)-methylase SpoU
MQRVATRLNAWPQFRTTIDGLGIHFIHARSPHANARPLVITHGWPGSVVGTLLTATVDHRSADYRRPTLILMGNEQAGLTPELAALCDVNVKIPMRGRADSLNLSVAAGVMIYAVTA